MPNTFADSPTAAATGQPVRSLWRVTVQFETPAYFDGGVQTDPPEMLTVMYTVKAASSEEATRKAVADVREANKLSEPDGITVVMLTAELLPPVLE